MGACAACVALAGAPGCEPAVPSPRRPPKTSAPKTTAPPTTAASGASEPARVRPLPSAQPKNGAWAFRSRPDLRPPAVGVETPARGTAPGYVFVAPKKGGGQEGPTILDDRGRPVWFRPLQDTDLTAMDFKVQRYGGEPVLTWSEGTITGGRGSCEYVISDGSYQEVARVRAGNGYEGDHHEFLITERGTALITIYDPVPADLSALGGAPDGVALDGVIQEVNIATGEVVFEWHSLDHVGLDESYGEVPAGFRGPFDYFHINSIDVEPDGDLLVCGRRTFTVYKIDRETGRVIWRMGGKRSDFAMGRGTRSRYQHDARRRPDGAITLFDNGGIFVNNKSRGVVLDPDTEEMTVSLIRAYPHPYGKVSATQGNMQTLPNGNVFVGWGSEPLFSELSGDGELLFNARFPAEVESYRAFRFPWTGRPDDAPAVATEPGPDPDEVTLYASLNGATEVANWRVLAGPAPDDLVPVGTVPRGGFETAIAVRTGEPYLGVRAEDKQGRSLGVSEAVRPGG